MKYKRLNICLFSPYIPDHFGGGERYLLSVAEFLSRNHKVVIAIPSDEIKKSDEEVIRQKYQDFFQLDLRRVRFIASPLGQRHPFIHKMQWTKQFDVMYYLTDGSLFFSWAKRNILHIQIPFTTPQFGLINRLKLRNWSIKNTNSQFTKEVIERVWKTKIDFVHSPYVDTQIFKPATQKSNIILHVGRFFSHLHTKRQDILVKSFKKLLEEHPKEMKGWEFVMIGGVEDEVYAQKITTMSEGYPIKIIHDASAETVKSYYSIAKIYWHATGYSVDEYINPMLVEHFGISTIEAMSSGAVPIVINKGGQKELIEHGVNGFLWNELEALEERTLACITGTADLEKLGENARESVTQFSPKHFFSTLVEMIDSEEPVHDDITGNISVIIPTYNGKKLLEKNLESVIDAMREHDELVIVDDCSTDDTVIWLVEKFQLIKDEDRAEFTEFVFRGMGEFSKKKIQVTLVQNKKNERFGASCNKGVKFCAHELLFVVNNDVKPHPQVFEKLIPHFLNMHGSAHQLFGIGCLEVQIVNGKEENAGKNTLWFQRGLFVHAKATQFTSGETAWVSGGSGMFNKHKWLELGGFDLRFYPAYWEDIDLSQRARERGWDVLFEADAVVEHHHESTNQTAFGRDQIEIMSFRNIILFTWLHTTFFQKIQMVLWMPYHLIVTNTRSKGLFLQGFLRFLTK